MRRGKRTSPCIRANPKISPCRPNRRAGTTYIKPTMTNGIRFGDPTCCAWVVRRRIRVATRATSSMNAAGSAGRNRGFPPSQTNRGMAHKTRTIIGNGLVKTLLLRRHFAKTGAKDGHPAGPRRLRAGRGPGRPAYGRIDSRTKAWILSRWSFLALGGGSVDNKRSHALRSSSSNSGQFVTGTALAP
jgi:hypothetical protein